MFFVWWRYNGRIEPQKWHVGLDYGLHNWKRPFVASHHAITDAQAKLSLGELGSMFPAPAMQES